ncbi:hypothetical protein XELAEV_18041278mg [Xenopus laevis]|uniref:Uncharacterized protein n=1 Tax=Xenopus laevis TaxID=8355 RepID=A0A974C255_XENLA|nr:hypothetical protein XELAEV_18041278mg [Xenopus laevis]
MCLFLCAVPIYMAPLHINSNLPKSLFYFAGASEMGLRSIKDRLYLKGYQKGLERIYMEEEGICEIMDFEGPLAALYLNCMRQDIICQMKWALYDYWMAKDSMRNTRWWKIRLMSEFQQDKRKAKAQLRYLYKILEAINQAILRRTWRDIQVQYPMNIFLKILLFCNGKYKGLMY